MARFRATIQGQRGSASRLGGTKSGMTAKVDGWDIGVTVEAEDRLGRDEFQVFATGGSHNVHPKLHVGTIRIYGGKPVFEPANLEA